jgi:hypothetical protein
MGGCQSENKGVEDLVTHIKTMAKACPNQKYVLGGNSQGSVIVTRSVRNIPKDILPRVMAITMFGAPACLSEVKDRCRSYCNKGDDVSGYTQMYRSWELKFLLLTTG